MSSSSPQTILRGTSTLINSPLPPFSCPPATRMTVRRAKALFSFPLPLYARTITPPLIYPAEDIHHHGRALASEPFGDDDFCSLSPHIVQQYGLSFRGLPTFPFPPDGNIVRSPISPPLSQIALVCGCGCGQARRAGRGKVSGGSGVIALGLFPL